VPWLTESRSPLLGSILRPIPQPSKGTSASRDFRTIGAVARCRRSVLCSAVILVSNRKDRTVRLGNQQGMLDAHPGVALRFWFDRRRAGSFGSDGSENAHPRVSFRAFSRQSQLFRASRRPSAPTPSRVTQRPLGAKARPGSELPIRTEPRVRIWFYPSAGPHGIFLLR
jgi:hypothetical protein